jgi:hypothetical protein
MKHAILKVAPGLTEHHADQLAMSAALDRLYGAAASQVPEIVSRLLDSERATLAMFCIGRAHLNTIGLAVAAQCSLDHLTEAAGSSVAGSAIYAQSRELPVAMPKTHGHRRLITLATRAPSGFTPRIVADED